MKASKQNSETEPVVRVLKSASCPSLSGKSKLSYEVGATAGNDIQLRVVANSAAGSFNGDWLDMAAVMSALEKGPRGAPVTSQILAPLFRAKSVNNQLFVFGIVLHEGLVRRAENGKRGYERADTGEFLKRTQALIEGKGTTTVTSKKSKLMSAAKTKKPAASTKNKK